MIRCDFCICTATDMERCKCLHSFCNDCAVVMVAGASDVCEFCPRCAVECEVKNFKPSKIVTSDPPKIVTSDPPSDFCCPITKILMSDPVIISDGTTYERDCIVKWLMIKRTSPLTGVTVSAAVTPNIVLRSLINTWKEQNPQP